MLINVAQFHSRQRLDVPVSGPNGANRLLIYGGVAELDPWAAVDNILAKDDVNYSRVRNDRRSQAGRQFRRGALHLGVLHGIRRHRGARRDLRCQGLRAGPLGGRRDTVATGQHRPDNWQIHTKIAFQGERTSILRLSYHADILAIESPGDVQMAGFDLAPGRISSSPPLSDVSTGTVTLQQPAPPGGITVQILVDPPLANLVSAPANVSIQGGTVGTFRITARAAPQPPVNLRVEVSHAGRAISRALVVGGT